MRKLFLGTMLIGGLAVNGFGGSATRLHAPDSGKKLGPAAPKKEAKPPGRSVLRPKAAPPLTPPPPEQCEVPNTEPTPARVARPFSPMRPNEKHLAELMLRFFNLNEDEQLSVDAIEAKVGGLLAAEDVVSALAELYEEVARKEAKECNPEYLNQLMKERFLAVQDVLFGEDKQKAAALGFSIQDFKIFEIAISRATGKLDQEQKAAEKKNFPGVGPTPAPPQPN